MVSSQQLVELVRRARADPSKRNFAQSFELLVTLRDIDPKKQELNINETVFLPHKLSRDPGICVFASGDLAVRAKKAGAGKVVEPEELDRLASEKRNAKKLARNFGFFLAETSLMPKIGRILGPFLGPKGRMPMPVPPTAPLEGMIGRFRSAVRARGRGQMAVACKVGDEGLSNEQVAENVVAVTGALEKKLPAGARNFRGFVVKLSMGKPAKAAALEG